MVREMCAQVLKQVIGIDVPVKKMRVDGTTLCIETSPLFKHEIHIKHATLMKALRVLPDTAHIEKIKCVSSL